VLALAVQFMRMSSVPIAICLLALKIAGSMTEQVGMSPLSHRRYHRLAAEKAI
jgi:hypothetical protein